MHYITLYNNLYNNNYCLAMPKLKTMIELIKESKYKSLHLDNFNKKYLDNNNKNTKISDIINFIIIIDISIIKYTIYT